MAQVPEDSSARAMRRKYAKLLARVWADPDLKQRLIQDPRGVLASEGISLPPGIENVEIMERSADTMFLIIPPAPTEMEISEEFVDSKLTSLASGTATWTGERCCYCGCL